MKLFVQKKHVGLAVVSTISVVGMVAFPAHAADLFATAKDAIKTTAGEGSSIEMAILSVGAIGGMIGGFMQRNWVGAIGGFVTGSIFWAVVAPMIGLA